MNEEVNKICTDACINLSMPTPATFPIAIEVSPAALQNKLNAQMSTYILENPSQKFAHVSVVTVYHPTYFIGMWNIILQKN